MLMCPSRVGASCSCVRVIAGKKGRQLGAYVSERERGKEGKREEERGKGREIRLIVS